MFPFPLTPHVSSGVWRKKIAGRQHSFGPLRDPMSAYRDYLRNAARLAEGRTSTALGPSDDPTVHQVATLFLRAQQRRLELGKIRPSTFRNMHWPLRTLVDHVGMDTPASHLTPEDFAELIAATCPGRSPSYQTQLVGIIRQMFSWSRRQLDLREPPYGMFFDRPGHRERIAHADTRRERPLTPSEFWRLIAACESIIGTRGVCGLHRVCHADALTLRAAMLLALNGGITQRDLSEIRADELADDPGTMPRIDNRRHKTGIPRVIPLWPETMVALRLAHVPAAVQQRAGYMHDARPRLLTLPSGRPLITDPRAGRSQGSDHLHQLFSLARAAAGLDRHELHPSASNPKTSRKRHLITWRTFRKTFDTVAMEVRDDETRRLIMAHGTHAMDRTYVLHHPLARLRMVSEYVRSWLLGTDRTPGRSMEDHALDTHAELARLTAEIRALRHASERS